MPVECDQDCGGITYEEWVKDPEVVRSFLLYCATTANLPPDPVPPDYGTSAFSGGFVGGDSDIVVLAGWSSFTVTNLGDSAGNITAGDVSIPPGLSLGHGAWLGYPGEAFSVIVPSGSSAVVSWVIPTV